MLWEYFSLIGPGLLMLAAALAFARPGLRPGPVPRLAELAALGALFSSVVSSAAIFGPAPLDLQPALASLLWLDGVSACMLLLVSFVGWVVLRYSRSYLDGEQRQDAFTGWMCSTLAGVLILVQAGHWLLFIAAWIGVSMSLHQLLVFYPQRPGARRAAHKAFLTARASDAALAGAAIILWQQSSTSHLEQLSTWATTAPSSGWTLTAACLIATAAILRSAQFPAHGWLTEVMETPTPVSALLHAGVINAGGFLLIRLADSMLLAPGVLAVLAMVGGFTAVFGGLVMLTQPAVKTSLAWSTVAQMGFMILQCGLALFPLALLHILAHSLYKAHAFLVSGGAVENVAAIARPGPIAVPSGKAVGRAFILALTIYALVATAFGLEGKSPQAIALGAILIFGVAYLLAQGLADKAPKVLTQRTALYSVAAAVGYFALQRGIEALLAGNLPAPPAPGPLEWAVLVVLVICFAVVAVAQAMFPLWSDHPAAAGLRVHLNNGLYANALLDRMLRSWRPQPTMTQRDAA
nr:NADH-quinone oxidoreductase subunit L [Oceanococcus sp. HetDA_MAG_MS8]